MGSRTSRQSYRDVPLRIRSIRLFSPSNAGMLNIAETYPSESMPSPSNSNPLIFGIDVGPIAIPKQNDVFVGMLNG
jgi:hypothetical protein